MTIYEEIPKAAAAGQASLEQGEAASSSPTPSGLPSANPSASYWLHDPSPILTGYRSTPDLPTEVDVVVIGSGITGSFAADALVGDAEKNVSVLLLEAREACFGATGRNGGHCQPMVYYSSPDVAEFELATFHFLQRFVAEHNIPCDWRTLPEGGVHAYLDADLFDAAVAVVDALATKRPDLADQVAVVRPQGPVVRGGPANKELTLDSLRLRDGAVAGALVQRHAASVWPYKLVAWVLERLVKTREPQFNLQTNTPVNKLHKQGSFWLVDTARGQVKAKAVLLATNGYTSHLLPPSLADIIVPVRAQVAALVPPAATKVDVSDAPATTSSSTSSTASSSGGVSRSSVTVTKTANGRTTTTKTATGPADLLTSSYVFIGHDHDIVSGHGERDEYLVQRPFGGPCSSSASASASASATAASSTGGHFILGGGRERAAGNGVGVWQDDVVEAPVAEFLRTHLAPVLDVGDTKQVPEPLKADYEWTGIMGFSRDHRPWVGRVPTSTLDGEATASASPDAPSGLYIAAGFSGHGMPSTSLCGRAAARMIRQDLGWTAGATASDQALPSGHLLTTERLARVRATCPPVAEADTRGFIVDFQEMLAARIAGL